MEIKRLLTNVISDDLEASMAFYTQLFAFNVDFDSDWFVHLISEGRQLELGILKRGSDWTPKEAEGASGGLYLTFVVEDIGPIFDQAQARNYTIIEAPKATPYGQMRLLLQAPEGTLCDVSAPLPH